MILLSGCSSPTPEPEITQAPSVHYSGEELEKVLEEFSASDDQAKVISDKQLRASIPKAQEWIENAKVNPSKCGVTYAEPVADQLKSSTMAAIDYQDTYLTVAIYKDSESLKQQWDAKSKANEACARYSVKMGNETRAYHLAKQPLESSAELSDGYVVTSSDGTHTQQQLILRVASANILVGIHQPTTNGDTADEVKNGSKMLHELLERLT